MIEFLEQRIAPATFTVSNLADAGAGSLRDAIENANDTPGKDFIKFAKTARGTIALASELLITDDLSITGPGAAALIIDAGGGFVATIDDGTGTVKSVTISGISLIHGEGSAARAPIAVAESLTLTKVVISGMDNAGGQTGALTKTGPGTLTIVSSQITGAMGEGAITILGGNLSVNKSVFAGNAGSNGGAIRFESPDGALSIVGSTFTGNHAAESGGALFIDTASSIAAVVRSSTFSLNSTSSALLVEGNGGAVHVARASGVVLEKSVFEANQASGAGGSVAIEDGGTVSVKRSTFEANAAGADGGGLAVIGDGLPVLLTVDGSKFLSNRSDASGGALAFRGDGAAAAATVHSSLVVNASTFVRNVALEQGGGIYVEDNPGALGETRTAKIRIQKALFQSNSAGGDGGGGYFHGDSDFLVFGSRFLRNFSGGGGGGLYLDSVSDFTSIFNVTFLQNAAAYGGGIAVVADGGLLAERVTVQQNYAYDRTGEGGGGIHVAPSDLQFILSNTKVIDNISASIAGGIRTFNPLDVLLLGGNVIRNNIP